MSIRSSLAYALLVSGGSLLSTFCITAQSPTLASVGQQAVDVVLKHYALNPMALEQKTGKALPPNGNWSVNKKAPATCPQTKETCLQVFYQVPAESVSCSWVVLLDEDGKDGKILDENKNAEAFLLRRVSGTEAALQINTRRKPIYPPIARAAHVSGAVPISVVVGATGLPERTNLQGGPEMLRAASLDAVRAWTFKPLQVGGKAIPYQVQVIFEYRMVGQSTEGTVTMKP